MGNEAHIRTNSHIADDILLIADTEDKLQQMVTEWTMKIESKGMELNPKKSKVMIVSKRPREAKTNITCKNENLESVLV